jgi:hypothetical protein
LPCYHTIGLLAPPRLVKTNKIVHAHVLPLDHCLHQLIIIDLIWAVFVSHGLKISLEKRILYA